MVHVLINDGVHPTFSTRTHAHTYTLPPVKMQVLPQISIQPDWHEAVRDVVGQDTAEESFWASCYKKGRADLAAKGLLLADWFPL